MKVSENKDINETMTNEVLSGQIAVNKETQGINTQGGISFKNEFEKLLIEKTKASGNLG